MEIYPDIFDVAPAPRPGVVSVSRWRPEPSPFVPPTVDNTHEIAQRLAPESRIVYVDNDQMVLVHARALRTSTPEGVTDYVDADVRHPEAILRHAAGTLDFAKPIALVMLGIMGHLGDDEDPWSIVGRLLAALPTGSHLVLSDGANTSEARIEAHRRYADKGAAPYHLRSPEQIGRFFDSLEILPPGVVSVSRWRPESDPSGPPKIVDTYGAVGRKP